MIIYRILFYRHGNTEEQTEWQYNESGQVIQLNRNRQTLQNYLKDRHTGSYLQGVTKIKMQIIRHRITELNNQRVIQMILINNHLANVRVQLGREINDISRHGMKYKKHNYYNDKKRKKRSDNSL